MEDSLVQKVHLCRGFEFLETLNKKLLQLDLENYFSISDSFES